MFQINFANTKGVFGVPNEVVDQHLQLSGALSLKVVLLLLRSGKPMGAGELAAMLNQTEGDIKDAINHWVQLGLVTSQDFTETKIKADTLSIVPPTETATTNSNQIIENEPQEKETDGNQKVVLKERFYRMTRHDVNAVSQTDDNVGVLLEESQNILSRTLSSGESETLVSLYHHYGMKLDIIIMLLHYCKTIEKDNPGYYEKMAIDWVNREINTHEKAERELLKLTEKSKQEQEIRNLFGIYNRGITAKEREFYQLWTDTYKTDKHMIKLAFERTIDTKGKVSFHYTNAIVKAWFEKGIKTPAQAEQESRVVSNNKKTAGNKQTESDSSYDLNELEKMISQGSVWD